MTEKICPFMSAGANPSSNKIFVFCQPDCAFYDERAITMPNKAKCLLAFMALNLASSQTSPGSIGNQ